MLFLLLFCCFHGERSQGTRDERAFILDRNYVYIHVNYNPRNQAGTVRPEQTSNLLQRLGHPARFGFPVLIVLNQEGKLLHIQDSSFLEEGKGYNHDKVLRFLRCWTPEAVKAD